jgi:hypothetical protein
MQDKERPAGHRVAHLMMCVLACASPTYARADETLVVKSPVYLGGWLAGQVNLTNSGHGADSRSTLFVAGLSWRSHHEIEPQERQRQQLLKDIRDLHGSDAARFWARDGIYVLIDSRAATGRVPVKNGDPRWLQGNPAADPLLEPGDVVKVPNRPTSVTVVRSSGSLCVLPYRVNAEVTDYIRTCNSRADPVTAWVAQPDGIVEHFGVAAWNREPQDLPGPGAWIWAPDRRDGWPDSLSERIAEFFATQGVSDDDPRFRPTVEIPSPPPSDAPRARAFPVTGGDWGGAGILQTPTARMSEAGEASVSVTDVSPYLRLNVTLQPLDWLEFGFRYTDITNQLYGPVSWSGSQTYKDKSIDLKVRLLKESAYLPEMALGVRDIGGTGLFAGEYLVASKRAGSFDWSLGLGWGYLGARGNLPNPVSVLSSRFDSRQASDGTGTLNNSYFRGRTSLFGGVQYQTPWDKLILKLEYDGNNYQHEPFGATFKDRLPLNFGVVYRATPHFDLSAGFERGSRLMLGIAFHGNLRNAAFPKFGDPPHLPSPPAMPAATAFASTSSPLSKETSVMKPTSAPVNTRAIMQPPAVEANWAQLVADLEAQLRWRVRRVRREGSELFVEFDNPDAFYLRDHLDRAANVLNRDAPADVAVFRLQPDQRGLPLSTYTIDRAAWVASHTRALPPSEQKPVLVNQPPLPSKQVDDMPLVFDQPLKRFTGSIGPGYQQFFGGPNGFLYAISAVAQGELRLTPTSWISGAINVNLLDNYSHYTQVSTSNLPPVRTDIRQYVTSSRVTIPVLQAIKVGRIGESGFYSVYGGLLESMFAGVGGEYLYRPWGSHFAIGVDANEVRQRGFRQDFSLMAYQTFTGHVTAYWDTGWHGVQANISFGRYLAKDVGVTVDISRRFRNGVTIGAYATKTNVSAAQFGEGSFDKGIYLSFPFDIMLPRSTGETGKAMWEPLLRDGGAKLNRQYTLYDMTEMSDPRSLWYGPPNTGP